jgi:hypothetical protein
MSLVPGVQSLKASLSFRNFLTGGVKSDFRADGLLLCGSDKLSYAVVGTHFSELLIPGDDLTVIQLEDASPHHSVATVRINDNLQGKLNPVDSLMIPVSVKIFGVVSDIKGKVHGPCLTVLVSLTDVHGTVNTKERSR